MASVNWSRCLQAGCPCGETPDWNGSYRAWTVEMLANEALVDTVVSATTPGSVAPSHTVQRELERAIVAILESERRHFDLHACPWQIAREAFRTHLENLGSATERPSEPLIVGGRWVAWRRARRSGAGPRRSARSVPSSHRGPR